MSPRACGWASIAASGSGAALAIAWGATGAPWALWGSAGALAASLAFILGGYLKAHE